MTMVMMMQCVSMSYEQEVIQNTQLCVRGCGRCSRSRVATYVRLVVVGSTLTDLWGEVVWRPDTGPGQLHGAAQTVTLSQREKPQTHFKDVCLQTGVFMSTNIRQRQSCCGSTNILIGPFTVFHVRWPRILPVILDIKSLLKILPMQMMRDKIQSPLSVQQYMQIWDCERLMCWATTPPLSQCPQTAADWAKRDTGW